MQAVFFQEGKAIDYIPGADVAIGQVVVLGSIVGIAVRAIASGALGSLAIAGVFNVAKVNGAIGAGVPVYWDADGDPQGGTAGTGAATTTSTDNTFLGHAVAVAGVTDETVRVVLGRAS